MLNMNFGMMEYVIKKDDIINAIKRTIGGCQGQRNNSQKWNLVHEFYNVLVFTNEGGETMEVTLDNMSKRFILLETQIGNCFGKIIYDIKRDTMNTDLPSMIDYYMGVLKAKNSINRIIRDFYGFSKYVDMLEDLEHKLSDMFFEFGDNGYYEQQIYILAKLLGYDEKDLLGSRIELQL